MNDELQSTPPATVPTAISVDPPPTSTTATVPGRSSASVLVAPRNAIRASSCSSRISTSTGMPATNSARLSAARIAAVATTRTPSAPRWRASATCSATTRPTSPIFSGAISGAMPRRVNARCWSTSVRRPSFTSATSTRVVFVPMSTQAQTIGRRGCCHHQGVPAPVAIEVEGLRKSYDGREAVRGIDFRVQRGEVFGLLGPNGAGKTTTVEILEGYRERSAGDVRVLGFDPGRRPRALRERMGIVLQQTGIYNHIRVREALVHFAGLYPHPRDPDEVIALVGLEGKEDAKARQLSGGQLRRLDFALALIGDPELVFLDEPTTGFDPGARRRAWESIRTLRSLGKTVVLTTHYLEEAQELADRVAIIKEGRILAVGAPRELGVESARRVRVTYRDPASGELVEQITDDPTRLLHELTGEALARGEQLEELHVSRPSLEEIYLELTADV